ncbi:hypothetical protein DRQ18_03010 [bacterium]|mgnify:FL=1|nr:MAG: hypothetical protein DRQ18_03010 [bacterium]
MGVRDDILKAAHRVYETLGGGHEEVIYREAMCMELQDMGYTVKTEMPVTIEYTTSAGKTITVGSVKVDIFLEKEGEKVVIELKAVKPLLTGKKEKDALKEYAQLVKYLKSLGNIPGFLINFPFPPVPEGTPEVIESG